MSRSNRQKEKYEKSIEMPHDRYHEGTAARTRPLSFDEIMSKRKNKKKLFENEKEGALEDVSGDGDTERNYDQSKKGKSRSKDSSLGVQKHLSEEDANAISKKKEENTSMKDDYVVKSKDREIQGKSRSKDCSIGVQKHLSEEDAKASSKKKEENTSMKDDCIVKNKDREIKGKSRSKDSFFGVQKHLSGEDAKASSKKKEENTSIKEDYLVKNKDREVQDSKTKLKVKIDKDLKDKGKTDENIYSKRKRDERRSNNVENEALKKHSRDLPERDRHVDRTGAKYERENKRTYRNGVDEKNRDRYPTRKNDLGKGHDSETSDRKDRKEISKSHYEELNLKSRQSRSREHVDRKRRSISPLPRSQKRASYYGREHGEPSSSLKGRSERQHSDIDKSKITNNGSGGYYKRHGGSTSGLGGYSPRKRRTEAAAKTPSPTKRSPEKKSAKWDLAPKGADTTVSVSVPPIFPLSNQLAASNIHEVVNAVPLASTIVKHSGVSFSILSTSKNDSIDSVQLTQATRPMRRLYVENIPASATEKALMEYFNNCLISSGVNHIQGTQPCISCMIHKEKGQALVEFLTPEDASAALSFDGRSFFGSIIKIRRPKDFVEVATGEPEKSAAAVDAISDVVKDSPHKIFVGGISKALSSKMIMEIASAFGPLKAFRFVNSDEDNEPCAFLEYADQSVTFKACSGLNGMKLGGQVVTAVQAVPNASTSESGGDPPFYGIPEHAKPLLRKPTQVIKLINLFDPEALPSLSQTEIEVVLEDVRLECTRFGTVKSVNVVKYSAAPISASAACGVYEDVDSAGPLQNLGCSEKNAETEPITETDDHKIVEGNGVEDDKPEGTHIEGESCQPGQSESNMVVDNHSGNSIPDTQALMPQTSKDESDCFDGEDLDNIQMKDINLEDEMKDISSTDELDTREALNLEEVSGISKASFVDAHVIESDAIEKGDHNEHRCDPDHIFEPGSVFVEFRRTEASCIAAHFLHGRLFDNRAVTVGYVPLDVYQARFPKRIC